MGIGGESSPALVFDGVGKRFGDTLAVSDIDLTVEAGATVALVGESGSGKSTLLRLAVGLVEADTGRVRTLANDPTADRKLRRQIGYVIQEGGLFPHLDARTNVELPARAAGWSRDRIAARVDELAALVGLSGDQLDRAPGQLSGGQRQRVSLMRALVLEPALLLLDEPLGALDPIIRFELQDELLTLFGALETTVVLVTHDLPEAAYLTDDIVVLYQGRIQQRGTIAELRSAPAGDYVERLIGAVRELPG